MTTLAGTESESEPQPTSQRRPRRCVMQVTWSLVAGGAETYALTVASGLDPHRYRAILCGVDKGGALEPEIERRRIPYHVMHRRDCLDLRLMWRMFVLFRRERVDVIHTHHFNQLFYSFLPAKLLGIRIIHTEHSAASLQRKQLCWALKLMSLMCHGITGIGADVERALRERAHIARNRLTVIRAAVDLGRFTHNRDEARRTLGLTNTDRVLVIVARLFPEKRHTLLLQALKEVLPNIPDTKLLIVGDGIEQQNIEQQIERLDLDKSVRMLGARLDVPRILAASDVFVLCSQREGLPIALLEAMAASLPVIATPVGDIPRVVHHRETGLLLGRDINDGGWSARGAGVLACGAPAVPAEGQCVPLTSSRHIESSGWHASTGTPGEACANQEATTQENHASSKQTHTLATAITELLTNLPYAQRLGQAGRALIEKEFSLERMIHDHEQLYD